MAETALVADKLDAGEWLVRAAEQNGVPLRAALWVYDPTDDRWRLALEADPRRPTTPRNFAQGLHDAVATIRNSRRRQAAMELLLADVSLHTQPYALAEVLRSSLGNAASVFRAKLSNAVLYRLEPAQSV